MAFFILCQFFFLYDIWEFFKVSQCHWCEPIWKINLQQKNLQKKKNLVLFALNSFLYGDTSKPRNHDFRYLLCHFFFNCNFSIYMYLFLISCCKQTLIIGILSKVSIKILLPTYMIVLVHKYWFYSLLVFSAKSCTSEYLDKLFISLNSILSAGQTGQWYWVYGVK